MAEEAAAAPLGKSGRAMIGRPAITGKAIAAGTLVVRAEATEPRRGLRTIGKEIRSLGRKGEITAAATRGTAGAVAAVSTISRTISLTTRTTTRKKLRQVAETATEAAATVSVTTAVAGTAKTHAATVTVNGLLEMHTVAARTASSTTAGPSLLTASMAQGSTGVTSRTLSAKWVAWNIAF